MSAIKRTTAGILFPACVLILSGCRDKDSAGTDPAVELKTTTVTLAGATGSEQNVSFGGHGRLDRRADGPEGRRMVRGHPDPG